MSAPDQQRFESAQSGIGRMRLNAKAEARWLAWSLMVRSRSAFKRFFDLVLAIILLILASPIFLLLALFIKRDRGPVFFKQIRTGLLGKEFQMFKFRSMRIDAEERLHELLSQNEKSDGVTFKLENDPRVTTVGRFIRRCSLDELPQLINVIKGEMSLVGPRPPVRREVALYSQLDRHRFYVKPGITCLWQVGERKGKFWEIGNRNEIDFTEQVELDVRYIENRSFLKDLWILVKTIPALLFGK
ncbi:MAG: sugar transferase [Verrucomicrobia bacterium]|jgi:lipopolysaccharide/colanic/teichoic acid biosynthesis glycosyltransferase|nr:sugar transferase [Verrucomicrobiota bacterium]